MKNNIKKINASEKLLVEILLENLKAPYLNIKYKFSDFIQKWPDKSGSFDFYYSPKKDRLDNVIGNIAEIHFYDEDEILCEATLSAYKDESLLSDVDILKLSEKPLIRFPKNRADFFS